MAISIRRASFSQFLGTRIPVAFLVLGLGLAACGSPQAAELKPDPVAATGLAPGIGECSFPNLTTLDASRLAIAHVKSKAPYYVPRSLLGPIGFDVDVANEVALGLGFQTNQMTWSPMGRVLGKDGRPTFDLALTRAEKPRFSASLEYSMPYFTETQALLAKPDNPITKVQSTSELADATLGVVLGSTSQAYVRDELELDPNVYLSNAVIKAAVRDGYIDGMVVPVEQVPSILATSSEPLVVVAQLPLAPTPITYHLALPKGDPLLTCVDVVLAKLTKSGQLALLRAQWFADGVTRVLPKG
ncbi:MAG: transporter substrate-binding domain-containing protein [Actinomycetota bacterium]|nr:transporter substrate-binding domain-containing protein [Actinomycetota bacterium]